MVNWLKICRAIGVRVFLCLHVLLCIWRVTVSLEDDMYWLMVITLVPFVAEGIYTIVKRHGEELLRFSPSIFLYLGALLPGIWLLELDKTDRYLAGREAELEQADNSTSEIGGPSLNPAMYIIIIEEMMPYVVILSRWGYPRGKMTREQLSEILFAFVGIAADIMEFFSLFGEEVVRRNKTLNYCVLAIWTFAVLQFTMTVTIVNEPKRARKTKFYHEKTEIHEETKEHDKKVEEMKYKSEIFAIFLVMLMQDLPFVTMRLYTIITYNLVTYSLIFFTSKNILIILLLFYKVWTLCKKRRCPGAEDREDEDDDVDVIVAGGDQMLVMDKYGRKKSIVSAGQVATEVGGGTPQRGNYSNISDAGLKQRHSKKSTSGAGGGGAQGTNGGINDTRRASNSGQAVTSAASPPKSNAKVPREGDTGDSSLQSFPSQNADTSKPPHAGDEGQTQESSFTQPNSDNSDIVNSPPPASSDTNSVEPPDPDPKPFVSILRI